jgi:hypothetical protein
MKENVMYAKQRLNQLAKELEKHPGLKSLSRVARLPG